MRTSDSGLVIELSSEQVGLTPTAKEVTSVRRELTVNGTKLISELWMDAVGYGELVHHLRGELTRQD